MHRLQPVAHVGQRARHDRGERIGEVALAERAGEVDGPDLAGVGVAHGDPSGSGGSAPDSASDAARATRLSMSAGRKRACGRSRSAGAGSEEDTPALQSLMRHSSAVYIFKTTP